MGYIKHDAIIVTGCDREAVVASHGVASSIGMAVSDIILSPINGYRSFFIAPDGSKEGWPDSDTGDNKRKKFLNMIRKKFPHIDFFSVRYGGDEPDLTSITLHNGD